MATRGLSVLSSAPLPAPGAPKNCSKYKPKRKFYSAGNYISGETSPDSPDTSSPTTASDAQSGGQRCASLPFDFPPPRLETNSYSTMDVTPPKKRHLSGNKTSSILPLTVGLQHDVTHLPNNDVTQASVVTPNQTIVVQSNDVMLGNNVTTSGTIEQQNDVTQLNHLITQHGDVTRQHLQHSPVPQHGDVTQGCDITSQHSMTQEEITGSVLSGIQEDTSQTTLLQALETPQTTQEICMALLNMAFWRPDSQTTQDNSFTDGTSLPKLPGNADQFIPPTVSANNNRPIVNGLPTASQGTDSRLVPDMTSHGAQQYRQTELAQNAAPIQCSSSEGLGQSHIPCMNPGGAGGFPNSQIQVSINVGFNQGTPGNQLHMSNATNNNYHAVRPTPLSATVTSSTQGHYAQGQNSQTHTTQSSNHVMAPSQGQQLLVQGHQSISSTHASEVGVYNEEAPSILTPPQHKRRRTESETSHASDSTESNASTVGSDIKCTVAPGSNSTTLKKTTSLFPKPAKGRTLCEIVDVMSRRHQEDYYMGWTAEKILELPPDERPNVFPVTAKLKKELVSKSVTTENKKLAFSWLSVEPWAQDFRWKLQNGIYKTLSDAKRDASQLWRENCPDYDSSRAVRMRDDAGNIVMKRTRMQSGSEFAYRQGLRKAKVSVIVDQIWARRDIIREAMQPDKMDQLTRELKTEMVDYEPPSDRLSQLVDAIAFSLRKDLLSTEM